MKKVFTRTLLLSAGLVLGSLIIIGLAFSLISYNYVVREKRETLEATAEVIARLPPPVMCLMTGAFSLG